MKTKRHLVLYMFTCVWDITVCWPVVLLVWLFWGERLRFSHPPLGVSRHFGYGLWCDLKPDSWPTRSWYREKYNGEYLKRSVDDPNGTWETWGGTTLGHGGFFGPGEAGKDGAWNSIEEHENTHVEQFEAMMVRSFIVGGIAGLWAWSLWAWLLIWWLGYIMLGLSGALTAWLRGEGPYRGNFYEEAAYDRQTLYEQEMSRRG